MIDLASEIERVRPRAYKYLIHRFRLTMEDAEDAVEDAILSALKTTVPFAGRAKFSTYFVRIAINAAKMQHRGSIRVRRFGQRVPIDEALTLASRDNPERDASRAELHRLLAERIEHLPGVCQQTMRVFYLQGHTLEETAAICGIAYNTVKCRLSRGRRRLMQ